VITLEQRIPIDPVAREAFKFFLQENAKGVRFCNAYDERPVDIETFVKDPHFLNLGSVIRPTVMQDLNDLFSSPHSFMSCAYEEAVFDEAIGSGKSFKTSIIICYGLHHLLCLRSPQEYFGRHPTDSIVIMNMSVNEKQAKKVVFGEIRARIDDSPWFKKWHVDPNVRSELRFDKNITIIPGNSASTTPLGYNLVMAVMDEASFYPNSDLQDTAQVMYYALSSRIKYRFHPLGGLLVIISSPRYEDDFTERKMAEAEKNPQRIFSRRRALWEVLEMDRRAIEEGDFFDLIHPITKDRVKIPTRYQYEFTQNPERAWRDLGACPSLVLEPYIKQYDLVEACIDNNMQNAIDTDGKLKENFKPTPGMTYYAHVDLALRKDSCGIAVAHREGDTVYVDLIHRITGSQKKEIDIGEVRSIFLTMRQRNFRIGKVTFDQFQSAQSIQELRKKNIEAGNLSVDRTLAPYETLKELCYSQKIHYPYHEIFLREMERLEMIDGKKVDHPAKGSKDVSDAVAGAVFNAVEGVGSRIAKVSVVG